MDLVSSEIFKLESVGSELVPVFVNLMVVLLAVRMELGFCGLS